MSPHGRGQHGQSQLVPEIKLGVTVDQDQAAAAAAQLQEVSLPLGAAAAAVASSKAPTTRKDVERARRDDPYLNRAQPPIDVDEMPAEWRADSFYTDEILDGYFSYNYD